MVPGTSTDLTTSPLTSRIMDFRDVPPSAVMKIDDGLYLSHKNSIGGPGGSYTIPLPLAYTSASRLFFRLRTDVIVKVTTVMPVLGTSEALCRPGIATDQDGVYTFCGRVTSITVTNPTALDATFQFVVFQYPDLTDNDSWRDGYLTTGVVS